jgi:allantoate deiminase
VRTAAVQHYSDYAKKAGAARSVAVANTTSLDHAAVRMDPVLTSLLADASARATGHPARVITSGAGHDALIVARRAPAAMLFLRSPGGISHHPDEAVLPADVEAALAAGVEFLRILRDDKAMLDARTTTRTRTSRLRREDLNA